MDAQAPTTIQAQPQAATEMNAMKAPAKVECQKASRARGGGAAKAAASASRILSAALARCAASPITRAFFLLYPAPDGLM
ncbi:hypothetical protein HWV62_2675 [Athelia sp. TMB]|nr:hypothetical protein HWV62_2675 [Athelia sp. TMB]